MQVRVVLQEWSCDVWFPQGESDAVVKMEFDEDGEGAAKENSLNSSAAPTTTRQQAKGAARQEREEGAGSAHSLLNTFSVTFHENVPFLPGVGVKLR